VRRLRQRAERIGDLVEPAALLPGLGEHVAQRGPEPQRAIPDGQDRGAHAAALAVAQQICPGAGRFPVALGQGDEFLGAVDPYPDHDEQAEFLLVQSNAEVYSVGPQVHVVHIGQTPVGEAAGLVLPRHGQPADRRRGQARPDAQEALQRGDEVLSGQAVQVQQRQHLGDLRRLATPRRQNRRGEPLPLTSSLVHPLVIDPRRRHLHRPGRGQHPPRLRVPVTDHQPPTPLVDLLPMRGDVRRDLGLQRSGQHPPSTLPHDLIDQRPTHHRPAVAARRGRNARGGWRDLILVDYREHRRTFPTRVGARALHEFLTRTRSGGYASRRSSTGFEDSSSANARIICGRALDGPCIDDNHASGCGKPAFGRTTRLSVWLVVE
jgi:hypothetical protein